MVAQLTLAILKYGHVYITYNNSKNKIMLFEFEFEAFNIFYHKNIYI